MLKEKTVQRWTLDDIEREMIEQYSDKQAGYVSDELTLFVGRYTTSVEFFRLSPKKTVCLLTLKNGFDVIGDSGCINPNHYRADIGSKYALRAAADRASEIIAYEEQTKLANEPGTESYCKPE